MLQRLPVRMDCVNFRAGVKQSFHYICDAPPRSSNERDITIAFLTRRISSLAQQQLYQVGRA